MSAFGRLWAASGSANLADGVILTSLPLIALGVGASTWEIALIAAAATLAWPLAGLTSGMIVDRAPKRALFVIVNLARSAAFTITAAVAAADLLSPLALMLAAGIYGLAETLADTALIAALPLAVTPRRLVPANARVEATMNIANQFLGPPAAGVLVGVSLWAAPMTGALLYLLAALVLAGMVLRPLGTEAAAGQSPDPSSA